jgi:hypothetical protein
MKRTFYAPTMSSTKKNKTSITRRRVILVERDKAMGDGDGRRRRGCFWFLTA